MKALIDEAQELIQDRPEESLLIYEVLTNWDEEMKQAFVLAWRILKDEK